MDRIKFLDIVNTVRRFCFHKNLDSLLSLVSVSFRKMPLCHEVTQLVMSLVTRDEMQ